MTVLDPLRKTICGALTKKSCFSTKEDFIIKDLNIVVNRNLKDMMIVDILDNKCILPLENLVPILKWEGDPSDSELKHLTKYLMNVAYEVDVRVPNIDFFKLEELVNEGFWELFFNFISLQFFFYIVWNNRLNNKYY